MKRVFVLVLLAVIGLQSCKKEDNPIFDQSPDERLNAKLAEYQTLLSGAQNGWKAVITTDSAKAGTYQGSYGFYFKFDNANRVRMYSDWDAASAVTIKESSYRLKALQQPSLIFDTYSYLHLLSDPDPDISGGDPETNTGLFTDFEFYFDSVTADTIKLVGRFNGSKAVLIKATAQEATAYNNGQLGAGLAVNQILTYFQRLTIGTQLFDVRISPGERVITFFYLDATGNTKTVTAHYYYQSGGIALDKPVTIGSVTISSFSGMTWNAATETFSMSVNNTPASLRSVVVPLKVDVTAPRRWWEYTITLGGAYWVSMDGFHVNGIDDAYQVTTLKEGTNTYYGLMYQPGFGPNYDFFGPLFLDDAQTAVSISYGTLPRRPTYTSDGRAIFSQIGSYGTFPATGPAVSTRAKLYDASGYYFIQTGTDTYDMVSASDGKAWISWEVPN